MPSRLAHPSRVSHNRNPLCFNDTKIFIRNTNSVQPRDFLQTSGNFLPLKSTHSHHHNNHNHHHRRRRRRIHRTPKIFNLYHHSEVCHPRCVFKLYGEVNSVKNTTINIWLNDGVY